MKIKLNESTHPAGVGLVQKTLQILDLFQLETPNWSQSEIAQQTGMPKSTVNRLVKFLSDRRYLTLLDGRNRYSLGPASIDLGRRASALFEFRGICQPMLEKLSRETSETVMLTSLIGSGNAVRCSDQIESTREGLRVFEQIGSIFPLHAGASPKAVLAFLPIKDRERYLARPMMAITKNTMIDPVVLNRDLDATRDRGYSISKEETYEGVAGIGAPFFWNDARPAGSLAIALPIYRSSPQTIERFGNLLVSACGEVNSILSVKAVPMKEAS